MPAEQVDVVVIGGGLIGATLALALASTGVEVALVDATDATAPADTRASLVAAGPWRMWRALGVAPSIAGDAQPITALAVETTGRDAATSLGFDARELASEETIDDAGAPLGWMVENRDAAAAIALAGRAAGVRIVAPARMQGFGIEGHHANVTLEDGRSVSAPIVVGADGLGSAVRRAAGIAVTRQDLRQIGVSAELALSRPHDGVARQLFTPAGPLALLPLTGLRANLVWSAPRAEAEALLAMSDARFEAHLAARLADAVGTVRLAGPRRGFPLVTQRAEALIATRVALVGEAAHSLHPVAGQGLNLGLRDVAALAQVLVEARRLGEDVGGDAALARYARWRRLDAFVTTTGVGSLARVFARPGLGAHGLLASAAAVAFARRGFMREASGDTGDTPRLLRGEAL